MGKSNNFIGFPFTFALMFFFWIVVSSSFDVEHIIIGAIVSFAVSYSFYDFIFQKKEAPPSIKKMLLLILYSAHLWGEIIKANINVARIVLDPKMPISPSIVKFKTRVKGEISKVLVANSITLTPGTLTLDIIDENFYVHALTQEAAEEVKRWHMEEKVVEIENAS